MTKFDLSKKARSQIIVRRLFAPLLMIAVLFLIAGRWGYWQAWVYWIPNTIVLILMGTVLTKNAELVEERLNPKEGMKGRDKFYFGVTTPLYVLALVLGGVEEWLRTLEGLREKLCSDGMISHPPLEKLARYYQHLAELAKGYEKDSARLAENLQQIYRWREEVKALEEIL